jgi:diaminopimelate decarboxylase
LSKPLQFFSYQSGLLSTGGISLDQIAKDFGTPTYVYSSEGFLTPIQVIQNGLRDVEHLICFAVKSNSNISILKMLVDAGAGMDLVSGGELHRAQIARTPANQIVFSGVGKTAAEMAMALQYQGSGIFSFNVESVQELHLLNQVALELRSKAPVALRFNPNVDPKTHPYISTGLKKNKFGMNRQEILKIVNQLHSLHGIQLLGISIHIGSQLLSLSPLKDAFGKVQSLIHEINSIVDEPIRFVDLGGGIGVTYRTEKPPSLEKYCELIQKFFGKKAGFQSPLKILLEPGRTISANSGILLTQVLYRKERAGKDFLIVDAGMNDLARPSLYGSYHEIIPIRQQLNQGRKKKTMLVGPVCESADCFAQDRLLSTRLGSGDLLAILSAGAYGFSMASNYNSRPKPSEILIRAGTPQIIRERESYEDLIRGERIVLS